MLRLPYKLYGEMISYALSQRPNVACGALARQGETVAHIYPCRNIATPPLTRFQVDPADLLAAEESARSQGWALFAIYSSQVEAPEFVSPATIQSWSPWYSCFVISLEH